MYGMKAIKEYDLKPFIDASCRREPDFQNYFPSITALCRKNKLAPQLKIGDIVVYLTKPGKYKSSERYLKRGQYYLSGILEVVKICRNHKVAEEWYESKRLPIPSNCLVSGNAPEIFQHTGSNFPNQKMIKAFLKLDKEEQDKKGKIRIRAWNQHYQKRADEYPQFNITKPIYKELDLPIEILREDLIKWFGKIPSTQTPKIITEIQFEKIKRLIPK